MRAKEVAWVTGGGTGIGEATARRLARDGSKVIVSGRRPAELDRVVAQLRGEGLAADSMVLDVADAKAVAHAAAQIADIHGPIVTLVCAAGINVPNRYWDALTPEAFAKVTAINLDGVAFCVGAVLPAMREARRGTIVVISSVAGWTYSSMTGAAYGATKTALRPLVESINDQEGRHGIRATNLCPGEVDTPILKLRPVPPAPEDLEKMLKPQDVADAVAFVVNAPPHVCFNEIVITPTWNRAYIGAKELKRF